MSIALPILIVSMVYPDLRKERLLTKTRFQIALVILFLDVLACAALLNPYSPNIAMYLLAITAVFAFTALAALLPRDMLVPGRHVPGVSPRAFFALGMLFPLLSFWMAGAFVDSGVAFIVPIILMLAISAIVLMALTSWMSVSNNKVEKAYFAAGIMGFFLLLGIVLTLGGWFDMALSAALALVFIVDFTRWSKGKRTLVAHVFAKYIYGQKK